MLLIAGMFSSAGTALTSGSKAVDLYKNQGINNGVDNGVLGISDLSKIFAK